MPALWKYNRRSGLWDFQRTCAPETARQWLQVFQNDEPKETFKLAANMPKGRPKSAPDTRSDY